MFKYASPGESVWSMKYGWVKVVQVNEIRLAVQTEEGNTYYYGLDGREHHEDAEPTLFWDEIAFEKPKQPAPFQKDQLILATDGLTPGVNGGKPVWEVVRFNGVDRSSTDKWSIRAYNAAMVSVEGEKVGGMYSYALPFDEKLALRQPTEEDLERAWPNKKVFNSGKKEWEHI